MRFKTNLHFHTGDDPQDLVRYTFYKGIDEAERLGFHVLGLTCHNIVVDRPEYDRYAEEHGILLIHGVERRIEDAHVVILNIDKSAERVNTFAELKIFRENHPECFILAPHPWFPGGFSLCEKLERNISLFDGVEHSWFYSKWLNWNKRGARSAQNHDLPYIATSDTHQLRFLDTGYAMVETEEKTAAGILGAIKKNRFQNITSPRSFLKDMVWEWGIHDPVRLRKNLPRP